MAESLERFRALVEKSPDAIFLVNADSEITYASASTSKVFRYAPEELVGRSGLELIHPDDRDCSGPALNLLDEPGVPSIVFNSREINARRAEGERRRQSAEELARSNLELQAFAHTVAHDLREPLRTISAFTELLVRKTPMDEDGKEMAKFIVDGVRRMSVLLDNLLSSASNGFHAGLERVELAHAAEQAMQNLRQAIAASGATIAVERLPAVQGNECDLVRVFQNLLSNAVKYRSEAPVKIHVTAEWFEPDWVIRIKDNGIGIPREHQNRVFGLFARLHTSGYPGDGHRSRALQEDHRRTGGRDLGRIPARSRIDVLF